MSGIRKYPRVLRRWHKLAECRPHDVRMDGDRIEIIPRDVDVDPEWWTIGDPGNELAEKICNETCLVRLHCLRKALQEPHTSGVIRGGITFTGAFKSRCKVCRLAVTTGKQRICPVCRAYGWCEGDCGRMVPRDQGRPFCRDCENALTVIGQVTAA